MYFAHNSSCTVGCLLCLVVMVVLVWSLSWGSDSRWGSPVVITVWPFPPFMKMLSLICTALVCFRHPSGLPGAMGASQGREEHFAPQGYRDAFSVRLGMIGTLHTDRGTESELASLFSSPCSTRWCWSSTCTITARECHSDSRPVISPCCIKPYTTTARFALASTCCPFSRPW